MKSEHSVLFDPIEIGRLKLKNRYVMAPMGPAGMSNHDGTFNQRGMDYYVERAKGGVGLIITGTVTAEWDVEQREQHMPSPRANPSAFGSSSRIMTERIHAHGAKIFAQLTAGFGRVLLPFMLDPGAELVGPSRNPSRWLPSLTTREISADEVKSMVKAFGEAAKVCQMGGFDGIEIHAVHEGYLLDQFATPLFNRRTDEYGGSIENRLRFAAEVVRSIKDACGEDFPVVVRYSPKHFIKDLRKGALPGEVFEEKGRDLYGEGIEMAQLLEAAGYDALDIDVGCYDCWYWNHPPMYFDEGLYLPFSEVIKQNVSIPVITAGRMDNPDLASEAISSGKTDLIGLARPVLADPQIVQKIQQERFDDVRPCLSCHQGCLRNMGTLLSCAVNPTTGKETELALQPALQKKQVLVVGGGVAGLETAWVSAIRGHAVTLWEKSDKLGGHLIPGGAPSFKKDDHKLIRWYERQLEQLGVDVRLNTEASKEAVIAAAPDVVVVATGSTPRRLSFPGSDSANVVSAPDALNQKVAIGAKVAIVGGGLVGCEAALWLAQEGKEVTIIETLPDILFSNEPFVVDPNEAMLRDLLEFYKVNKLLGATLTQVTGTSADVKLADGSEQTIDADTVIISVGFISNRSLYEELKGGTWEIHLLGDSKKVDNIKGAIWESYEVARGI